LIFLIMGVSGSGKTTVGRCVARALKLPFLDADDLHSTANILKMKKGQPLNDADREPWLKKIAEKMYEMDQKGGGVAACSALKKAYRQTLLKRLSGKALIVYLKESRNTLIKRMAERKDHFMPPGLLQSQLDALEEPENALILDIELSPKDLCLEILNHGAHQAEADSS
jgi:carbohydrate kinase (thermoresistant glucokinase family)